MRYQWHYLGWSFSTLSLILYFSNSSSTNLHLCISSLSPAAVKAQQRSQAAQLKFINLKINQCFFAVTSAQTLFTSSSASRALDTPPHIAISFVLIEKLDNNLAMIQGRLEASGEQKMVYVTFKAFFQCRNPSTYALS